MQLQLVVTDFHLEPAEMAPGQLQGLPRLAGLEAAAAFGRRRRAPDDWRAALAVLAGRPDLARPPPAQVAAAALGLPAGSNPWFATPVHLAAGLDHLRLHGAGLLTLQREELEALAAGFAQVFGGTGLALHPLMGGLLITGLAAREAATQDPARYLGSDVRHAPAAGADATELRRLGAEIEMWLHALPLNLARQQQGRLSVTALWIWGGGAPPPLPAPAPATAPSPPRGYSDDAFAAGLWQLCGGEVLALPPDLGQLWRELPVGLPDPRVLVVLSAAARGLRDAPLSRLDVQWIGPALQRLRAGEIARLSLHWGGRQVTLTRYDRLRFWRRTRPWWEGFVT